MKPSIRSELKPTVDFDVMLSYLRAYSIDLISEFESRSASSPPTARRDYKPEVMEALILESISRAKSQTQVRWSLSLSQIYAVLRKIEEMMPAIKTAKTVLSKMNGYYSLRLSRVIDVISKFARSTFKLSPLSFSSHYAEAEDEIQTYLKSLSGEIVAMVPRSPDDVLHIVTTLRFLKHLEDVVDLLFEFSTTSEV